MDFRIQSVADLIGRIRSRELSCVEVARAALERIEQLDGRINAFVALDGEDALRQAEQIDARLGRGESVGLLAGVPIGVKDLEDAVGFITSYGSALHTGDEPAKRDSVLVARLRAAGCVVVGKTNTPEFGFKGVTDNLPFGATANPWDLDFSAGGSSGGSAAALAAGMVPLATGSDGGGSIRIPSSVCGLSGIKTSHGRVPNGGHSAPGSGVLSVKGPMALRIRDVALALDAVLGPDPTDIFSLPAPGSAWVDELDPVAAPERVLWSPTMGYAAVDDEIASICERAVRSLAARGTEVIETDLIWPEDPVGPWFALWSVSRARTQGHLEGTPGWEKIDPALREQIRYGTERVSAVEYAQALDACHALNLLLEEAFSRAPILLTPAVAGHTPRLGHHGIVNGEETQSWVAFTYGLNMTRNPAGTVSAGRTRAGLPVGLQVIGRQRDDLGVLRVLAYLEDALESVAFAPIDE